MYFVIFVVLLLLASICLDWKERKDRENISSEEFVDIAQFTYEEKLRKYKSDYESYSPTIKIRF